MSIEADFKIGEVVRLINSELLKPEVRGVHGVVSDVQRGSTWGNPPGEMNRWEYTVDFDQPLGSQRWIPEGLLTLIPN